MRKVQTNVDRNCQGHVQSTPEGIKMSKKYTKRPSMVALPVILALWEAKVGGS